MTKRIGILTSGGDCSGLNACVRAVVKHAIGTYGWRVFGFHQATVGMILGHYEELTLSHATSTLLRSGGTFLGSTNRHDPFHFPNGDGTYTDRSLDVARGYHALGLDALIAIGGDGSMHYMRHLASIGEEAGYPMNLVGVPKTIDNDIKHTEISIGYTTALDIATEALDRLHPTAKSHGRVLILEVMGRDAGHIALAAGIAGGADVILIPEISYKINSICKKIRNIFEQEKRQHALIIVAEAAKKEDGEVSMVMHQHEQQRYGGIGHYVGHALDVCGFETRVTVLGHIQRGGDASATDRILASAFGVRAVDMVAEKRFDRLLIWKNRKIVDIPLEDVVQTYRGVESDDVLLKTAIGLGIYVGEI